jgi:MFS family permease
VSTSTSHQETRSLGLLAAVAIVGLAFFAATALLLPLISEYSLTADYISELVIGRYGYLQTAAFFAAGLGTLALSVGVRDATNGSWGARLGSALVGLYGVGLILAGILPTDEIGLAGRVVSPTSVGTMHSVVSALAFVFVIAGMFVLSRTFKRDARWQAVWPWSLVLALATLIGVIVAEPSEGLWVGLIQRTYIGTIIIWQVLVAFWLRSIAKGASAEQPPRVR